MPYFALTGAYLSPGEGPVEPYHWMGEAKDPEQAVATMQLQCREQTHGQDWRQYTDDLLEIIDIWEIHPDDVELCKVSPQAYVRMRPVD